MKLSDSQAIILRKRFRPLNALFALCLCTLIASPVNIRSAEASKLLVHNSLLTSSMVNLGYLLSVAGRVYGKRFCSESFLVKGDVPLGQRMVFSSVFLGNTLEQFLDVLRKIGFQIIEDGDVIIVRSPRLLGEVGDPLDAVIPSFVFHGKHSDFIRKLSSFFPVLPPLLASDDSRETDYEFDLSYPVTIRGVLVQLTERYGTRWGFRMQETIITNHSLTAEQLARFPKYEMEWWFAIPYKQR